MAKRNRKAKTRSQRIGTKGEHTFAEWCGDRHLTANKVSEDYGIDYFCEILERVSPLLEEPTGSILATQVRSVSGESRPRITLFRDDATNLLQQQHPACLIGVNTQSRRVYFRLVDPAFVDELLKFLATGAKSHSIPLSKMSSDEHQFDSLLQNIRRPVNQYTHRIRRVKRTIAAVVPGLELNIRNTDCGGMAMVHVPWIGSVFVAKDNQEALRAAVFERGTNSYELPGISLKPEFAHIKQIADGAFIIGAGEGQEILNVRHKGESERLQFTLRCLDDEFAFPHEAGITLVHSKARKRGPEWVHELEVRLFSSDPLDQYPEAIPFLKLLRPGAQISLNSTNWMDVENWPSLPFLGLAISGLCKLCDSSQIKLNEFKLQDFKDEELGRSLTFLNLLLGGDVSLPEIFPGFVLNAAVEDLERFEGHAAQFEIPIALNVKSRGVIVWVQGSGVAYKAPDDGIAGVRIKQAHSWKVERVSRLNKSIYPEIWVDNRMPPVRIGAEDGRDVQFQPKPNENILVNTKIIFAEHAVAEER